MSKFLLRLWASKISPPFLCSVQFPIMSLIWGADLTKLIPVFLLPIAWFPFHVLSGLHPPTETAFVLCFPQNNRPPSPASQAVFPVSFHTGPGFLLYVCLDCTASFCFLIACICILFTTRLHNAQGKMSTGIFLSWHSHKPISMRPYTHAQCTFRAIFKPSLPGPSGLQAGFPLPTRNS